jgi:CheY-like chemotaxis protein
MTPQRLRRILIIDDDRALLETAAHLLRSRGFDVATWGNTLGRLGAIAEVRPDLVLLDVNMPLVPGDELVSVLKDIPALRGIPVVFFSSNDEMALRRLTRKSGVAGYVLKSDLAGDFAGSVARFVRT